MDTASPILSVIMPVYNAEKYVEQAIVSIIEQTFTNFIFYILDDGSTDGTLSILEKWQQKDNRIHLLTNKVNRGITDSLNRLVDRCTTTYIARMDGDDIAHPKRFAKQIKFLESHPDISICGSWVKFFGEQNSVWKTKEKDEQIKAKLLFGNALAHPSVMFKSELRGYFYPFYSDDFSIKPGYEDYELWLKLTQFTKFHNIQEVLLDRRVDKVLEVDKDDRINFYSLFYWQKLKCKDASTLASVLYAMLTLPEKRNIKIWSAFFANFKKIMYCYLEFLDTPNRYSVKKAIRKELTFQWRAWYGRTTKKIFILDYIVLTFKCYIL